MPKTETWWCIRCGRVGALLPWSCSSVSEEGAWLTYSAHSRSATKHARTKRWACRYGSRAVKIIVSEPDADVEKGNEDGT